VSTGRAADRLALQSQCNLKCCNLAVSQQGDECCCAASDWNNEAEYRVQSATHGRVTLRNLNFGGEAAENSFSLAISLSTGGRASKN
jgi:hypothetical protein